MRLTHVSEGSAQNDGTNAAVRRKTRIAIVATHPVQHFVYFYKGLGRRDDLELKVFFCSRIGLAAYFDRQMNTTIAWQTDLLGGYESEFLPGADDISRTSFSTLNNPGVFRALSDFRPDAILTYGYSHLTALYALVWGRTHRVPVLMTGDSELLHERAGWKRAAKDIGLPRLLGLYGGFLTTGDNNENYYRAYGVPASKMFRAPFTIDEERYLQVRADRSRLRSAFRQEHGLPDDAFVALLVGKLYGGKRPGDLLDALERLAGHAAGRRVHAFFAGNGVLFDELSQRARDLGLPATFLGFVNVDRLPDVYAGADVLVHASEIDAHPLVCSEAACVGLPMILSDRVGAVGPTDVARAGENTVVYPCGDVAALADALVSLIEDPARVRVMEADSIRIYDELDLRRSIGGLVDAVASATKRGPA